MTHFQPLVTISYGEYEDTTVTLKYTIQALKDDIQHFYYYHQDSSVRLRKVNGFLSNTSGYQKMRDMKTCEVTGGEGPLGSLHRVTLLLRSLKKGETKTLVLKTKMRVHYQELIPETDESIHFNYYRMNVLTQKADLVFKIPLGKTTFIDKLQFSHEHLGQVLFEQKLEYEQLIQQSSLHFSEGYGIVQVKQDHDFIYIYWFISKPMNPGHLCKIQWYLKKKTDV